jgi:hypothetical protein
MYPYFNNQNMLNQLIRQKENVENMINQYSQIPAQAPIQNIINQNPVVEFEAKELKAGEDVKNILIQRKTLFIDEANKKIFIKELDGNISKEYDIIVPLDEKDKKIQLLEEKLKCMEAMINVRYEQPIQPDGECEQSVTNDDGNVEPKSKKLFKSIPKNESK